MKQKNGIRMITQAVAIAAIYVVLTYVANLFGMANGIIQVRISEALTVLPYFSPAAIPGLFIGCLLGNLVTGTPMMDVIVGSLTTLVAAFGSYAVRKYKYLTPIPPIIANMIAIPLLFKYVYRFENSIMYFVISIGIGEIISCGVLGIALLFVLEKKENQLFPDN